MARPGRRAITEAMARKFEARVARGDARSQQRAGAVRAPKPQNLKPAREDEFELMLRHERIGGWIRQYKFHPTRQWRLDFAWPHEKFAIEIDGGMFNNGGHVRPFGIKADYEKAEALHLLGWRLYRLYPDMYLKANTWPTVVRMYVDASRPMPERQGELL